ncbi:MAG: hypothetical protein JSR84_00980 [Proteobacteria bacterium]|nr:hypothetical protein [Pseudomonadota bacterium]
MAERPEGSGDSPSPFSERGWVIAAGLVLVLAAAAVVLLATGDGGGHDETSSSGPATTSTTTSTGDPAASVCGLPAGDQRVPVTPPAAHWVLIGQLAAPSGQAGPGRTSGGVRSCYAHSPTGALFAATNFLAAALATNSEKEELALLPLFADTAALEEAKAQPYERCPSASRHQLAGFRIPARTEDEVTVELALLLSESDGRTGLRALTLPMRWEDGDWKFVLNESPECGSDPYNVKQLNDLSGYVEWGAP